MRDSYDTVRLISLQHLLTRWAPCSALQGNNSEAAYYCILQQSGWCKVYFPCSATLHLFPPANSRHCGLPLNYKMLIHISELPVQTLDGSANKCHVFLWGNSPQAWAGPWRGCRNNNDHHLRCEFSLIRVFTVSLGETSVYADLQDEAQKQTTLQLLHLKGISSQQTVNKELQISSRWPDS